MCYANVYSREQQAEVHQERLRISPRLTRNLGDQGCGVPKRGQLIRQISWSVGNDASSKSDFWAGLPATEVRSPKLRVSHFLTGFYSGAEGGASHQ